MVYLPKSLCGDIGEYIMNTEGEDVTAQFKKGAALALAQIREFPAGSDNFYSRVVQAAERESFMMEAFKTGWWRAMECLHVCCWMRESR